MIGIERWIHGILFIIVLAEILTGFLVVPEFLWSSEKSLFWFTFLISNLTVLAYFLTIGSYFAKNVPMSYTRQWLYMTVLSSAMVVSFWMLITHQESIIFELQALIV